MSITLERSTLSTLAPVFRGAARIIEANGHWQGDYCPDPLDWVLSSPRSSRPLSIVAALRCAESGDPQLEGPLSTAAIRFLAGRLLVDGELPYRADGLTLQFHVAAWGDVPGRTVADVVEVLFAAADAGVAVAS